ncbi:ribonuclease H [Elysia marginata]|uniref:ribonuclease H n=1 Tax=Elysia marginata TaxID=1093978 RepID=A0AAV4FUC8_9GAST|nr:ribonuclease H [Elysia marginata]
MHTFLKIVKEIENIGAKAQLSEREIIGFTNKHLDKKYPIKERIRIYTDGSATAAVRNGGDGVYATLPDGTTIERSFACGVRCTNYKAETEAIKEALNMVNNKISKTSKVVLLSDIKSVLQTLENTKDTEPDTVRKKLLDLMARVGELTLQWIPGHSNIEDNERPDNLAKLGSGLDQEETILAYQEAKTMVKMAAKKDGKRAMKILQM